MIALIVWLKTAMERSSKAKVPGRRQKALAALAPVINGQAEETRVTGTWEGQPAEGASETRGDQPRWRVTLTLPPGGADWRLITVTTLGYMFQAGDKIGVESPLVDTSNKIYAGSASKEDIDRSVDQTMSFREAHARDLQQGSALVAGLGPLAGALKGNLEDDSSFGLPGSVSYEASSGRLTYETLAYSESDFPNPKQFTNQLKLLWILRDAASRLIA